MTTPIGGAAPRHPAAVRARHADRDRRRRGQINLAWGAATDNVGVTGYRIERCQGAGCTNFAQIADRRPARPTTTPASTASTSYSYRVRATDAAGNLGPYSNTATATTPATATPGLVAAYWFRGGVGDDAGGRVGERQHRHARERDLGGAGKYGKALSFNGTNARVTSRTRRRCTSRRGMTLEAWVNPAASPSAGAT